MFCPKCGTKAIEGAGFCQKCGTKLIVDIPMEQPAEVQRTNPVQQPSTTPMNASGEKKSKLSIILIVAALAIILIILAAIGSNIGSSTSDNHLPNDIDAASSETPDESESPSNPADLHTTGEVLYAGIPLGQLIGASPDEVIDALGNPDHMGAMYLEYKNIYVTLSENDNTVTEISGNAQLFTINDQTLDKGYDEIIQMLGEPDSETDTRYSNVLEYNTSSYQMFIYIDWEEGRANNIDFSLPLGNEDDWVPPGDIDDPGTLIRDPSLVGRWRSYDGGYVEFGDYGEAAISFSPHGSLLIPDYVTWEVSNGRIVLTSHFSETSTYEIKDYGSSGQRLNLSNDTFSGSYYYRAERDSSLVGTWDKVGSGYRTPDALVLLSDGTGTMHRLISSSSMGTVPITWWADNTKLRIDWALQSAYDYTVSGDTLTIFFSNGSNIYQRVG